MKYLGYLKIRRHFKGGRYHACFSSPDEDWWETPVWRTAPGLQSADCQNCWTRGTLTVFTSAICDDFWMMQLAVPCSLSFPCARFVKAIAALISFQYVSSLLSPFLIAALDWNKTKRKRSNSPQLHRQWQHWKAQTANQNLLLTCYWIHFPEGLQRKAEIQLLFFLFC